MRDLDAHLVELGLPGLPEALPRPVIDSHTHADTTNEYTRLTAADSLALAASVGVGRIVQIGCDVEGSEYAVALARSTPGVVATVSIHPNDAARAGDSLDAMIDRVAELAQAGDIVRGIGETGLDYFRTRDGPGHALQKHSFRRHIELAIELDKTLVIHDREAHDDQQGQKPEPAAAPGAAAARPVGSRGVGDRGIGYGGIGPPEHQGALIPHRRARPGPAGDAGGDQDVDGGRHLRSRLESAGRILQEGLDHDPVHGTSDAGAQY